jgi:hypothetical protein
LQAAEMQQCSTRPVQTDVRGILIILGFASCRDAVMWHTTNTN